MHTDLATIKKKKIAFRLVKEQKTPAWHCMYKVAVHPNLGYCAKIPSSQKIHKSGNSSEKGSKDDPKDMEQVSYK